MYHLLWVVLIAIGVELALTSACNHCALQPRDSEPYIVSIRVGVRVRVRVRVRVSVSG